MRDGTSRLRSGAAAELHERYHKVSENYIFVDRLELKEMYMDRPIVHSYYFDPSTNSLYSCAGIDDSGVCSGPDRADRFAWLDYEKAYADQNGPSPIDRHQHGSVYFLEGVVPFEQRTRYVYYSGEGKVVRCRWTFTFYDFELERNGEHLYFESDKEPTMSRNCEQLYPES